ncbi:hypothetical protein BJF78_21060 [Pseudonocardia sp. CNS-139]|nr:hypothetical protein BJF78_21060 [Pseudonocardia sp. CNS-139]
MTGGGAFRAVYEEPGAYDRLLLPHYFQGVDDVGLVDELLDRRFGRPSGELRIVELGCGTGRMTSRLAAHARRLTVVDPSPAMIDRVRVRAPTADVVLADARDALTDLLSRGRAGSFDVVAAFWALNYPLGQFFETMTADAVRPVDDMPRAREHAAGFVRRLVRLLAPGGHLLVLYFDPDTPEQQLVTRMWERIAPFPGRGPPYPLTVLLDTLRQEEAAGHGDLTHTRYAGAAWAPDRAAAVAWFDGVHFKGFPALVGDPEVRAEVAAIVTRYERPAGDVVLPSGVHVIDFAVGAIPSGICRSGRDDAGGGADVRGPRGAPSVRRRGRLRRGLRLARGRDRRPGLRPGSRARRSATVGTCDLDALVDAVRALHHDHGLTLDTEVAHAVKLYATRSDVDAAVRLRCFALREDGGLDVPPVVVEPGSSTRSRSASGCSSTP